MKKIIAVSGSNAGDENLTPEILKKAERVGELIARKGGILACGGLGGIMEAACQGAKKAAGTTIGILPYGKEEANSYVDIPIPTGLGYLRNSILVQTADSLIAICGRWGTLNEISFALILGKPTVILTGTGGVSDSLKQKEFLSAMKKKPLFASTPEEAVDLAFPA